MSQPDPAYRPSPLASVRRMAPRPGTGDDWVLLFARELRHPVDKVWAALTDREQLSEWAPYSAERSLTDEGALTLRMDGPDGRPVEMDGTVLRIKPPRLLEHHFGEDVLRWELTPNGPGTRLILRHTFGQRGEMAPMLAAGWHICLDVADALLAGHPFGPVVGAKAREYGWDELNQQYAETLGVEPVKPPSA